MVLSTPILFIVFNRPDLTRKVFEEIRRAKPEKLYISMDHPRNEEDEEKCKEVRAVFKKIDWNCEIHLKRNEKNLGCKQAVSSALDWFFDQEPMGIILEDDCLPCPSFFHFCQEMLIKYNDDHTVGHISGSCFLDFKSINESYYFSNYCLTWGWASWARVWKYYDANVSGYKTFNYTAISENPFEQIYWIEKFDRCAKGKINTWDYQLTYTLWKNHLNSINPTKNLISNIGFDIRATHWNIKNLNLANLPLETIDQLVHPSHTKINPWFDDRLFKKVFDRILVSNLLHWILFNISKYKNPLKMVFRIPILNENK